MPEPGGAAVRDFDQQVSVKASTQNAVVSEKRSRDNEASVTASLISVIEDRNHLHGKL